MTGALRVLLDDAAATRALGAAIADVVEGGDVVLLVGELGAGKTTLTKGLVAALGDDEEVTSPTFTLLHCYPTTPPVAHVDCWRLESLAEVVELGLDEILDDGGVAVIEWGELAAPLLGREALTVSLDLLDEAGDTTASDGDAPSEFEAGGGRLALLTLTGGRWTNRLRHLQMAARAAGLAPELLGAEATSVLSGQPVKKQ